MTIYLPFLLCLLKFVNYVTISHIQRSFVTFLFSHVMTPVSASGPFAAVSSSPLASVLLLCKSLQNGPMGTIPLPSLRVFQTLPDALVLK